MIVQTIGGIQYKNLRPGNSRQLKITHSTSHYYSVLFIEGTEIRPAFSRLAEQIAHLWPESYFTDRCLLCCLKQLATFLLNLINVC